MEFDVKKLFIFGIIFSTIYIFIGSFITGLIPIKDAANFNFMNVAFLLNESLGYLGGVNSWIFHIFYATINLTFLQYIFAYMLLPIVFIIQFFMNIILLISFEVQALNYPFSILPYGFGSLISGIFYLIIVITIVTGIKILSSGLGD